MSLLSKTTHKFTNSLTNLDLRGHSTRIALLTHLFLRFFLRGKSKKIIRVNDFAGASENLLAHLKFCWHGF